MIKLAIALLSTLLCNTVLAFTCYFTVAKDNCWTNYAVTVNVIDFTTSQVLTTITLPANASKSWGRQSFTCQPEQIVTFTATFSPTIWDDKKDKIYSSIQSLTLPATINPQEIAWNMTRCFPSDFAEVPMPMDAKAPCNCNLTSIPPITVQ